MNLSKIIIGAMRFKDRKSAIEIIRKGIDCGFNYVDTSPCYCYKSETENSEAWVGEAVSLPEYRNRVMVSTKCSPGDGGYQLGNFMPLQGFGVRTKDQLDQVFNQSLRRLNLSTIDFYHLWTVHTQEQFLEAQKQDGWLAGVLEKKNENKFAHLGLTTHADPDTIISILESGLFETVTMPLNIINLTRLKVVDYCAKKDIKVIAMNPLAGGFLAANARLKELAFRYLMALPNVHILVGFSTVPEIEYAKWIIDTASVYKKTSKQILSLVDKLIDAKEPRCTACGYCMPCPQNINVGACLSYYNTYKYLHIHHAKKAFLEKQWEVGLQLNRCASCGVCTRRCPNHLQVQEIIMDAQKILYT